MGLYFTGGFRSRGFWWSISDGFLQVGVDFAGGMRFRGFWWSMCGSFQLLKVVFCGWKEGSGGVDCAVICRRCLEFFQMEFLMPFSAGGIRFRGYKLRLFSADRMSYRGSRTPGGVCLLQRPHIHLLF